MEESTKRWIKGIVIVVVVLILFAILMPVSCVRQSDRGVRVRMGAVIGGVIKPGPVVRWPIAEKIDTYSIQPQQIKVHIPVDSQGAITKDNQTVGLDVQFFYRYTEDRVPEIARNWSEEKLKSAAYTTAESMTKVVIGTYTIFEVAAVQAEVMNKVANAVSSNLKERNYPFELVDLKLSNYDWSKDFDDQIKETMTKAQQVKQKEQEVQIAQLEASKKIKQAEAERDALIAQAEGERRAAVAKAEGEKQRVILEAEAKVAEGEGIRKYNASIASTWDIQYKLKMLEIEMIKAKAWNGQNVANNYYGPIPVDTVGGIKGVSGVGTR